MRHLQRNAFALCQPHHLAVSPVALGCNLGRAKLAVVLETASLNAEELSRYCREKGLYPDQIANWKQTCIDSAQLEPDRTRESSEEVKQLKKRNRALEKELRRKEKALAESAALLVLQKKFRALWEDEDE